MPKKNDEELQSYQDTLIYKSTKKCALALTLVVMLLVILALTRCTTITDPNCHYNSQCPVNMKCNDRGECARFLPPPPGPLVKGSLILPCGCYDDPYMSQYNTRLNTWCHSSIEVVKRCEECCVEENGKCTKYEHWITCL